MSATTRLIAVKPITVPSAHRGPDLPPLEVKVTAPSTGADLPVIVFSHGNAWSMDGYGPLVDRWAATGFVVVQPTHLDWRGFRIGLDDPHFGRIWRLRIADLHAVVDSLGEVLSVVGGLDDRTDLDRVAVVGHSWGGQSAGALLGARVLDGDGRPGESFAHPRVTAGALIAVTGTGDTLAPFALEHLSFMRPDYSTMAAPALVVAGGRDDSALSTRGPDWFTDAYHLGPAPKALLAIPDGEHTLGGLAGESVAETTDEDPARVQLVADAVAAFLLDRFDVDHSRWSTLRAASGDASAYLIEHK